MVHQPPESGRRASADCGRLPAAAGRVTAAFGPYRVALHLPPDTDSGRSGWVDPPGLPADLELRVTLAPGPGHEALVFQQFDTSGYRFETKSTRTEVRWDDHGVGQGHVTLDGASDPLLRVNAVLEALLGAGYAEVLRRGGALLHATTLWLQGRAHVVAGHSGAGKSTLAARFADRYLHDEHAFLVPGPTGWQIWRHAELRGPRDERPWVLDLATLSHLGPDRSRTARTPMPNREHFPAILRHTYFAGGAALDRVLAGCAALVREVPPQTLSHCLAEPDAAVEGVLARDPDLLAAKGVPP